MTQLFRELPFRELPFRELPCLFLTAAALTLAPASAMAQSQKTDIRPNANQLTSDEIKAVFSDQTHQGSYNFNRLGIARNGYIETHTPDGRVQYSEGEITADGNWFVKGETLCFSYEHPDMSGGCFRVYRIQNCFYYYTNLLPLREDEFDRDYWVARSTPAGETPNCLPATS